MDKVLTEISAAGDPFVLVIDDLHELNSAETAEQHTSLLTSLPSHTHAIVATDRTVAEYLNGDGATATVPASRHLAPRRR